MPGLASLAAAAFALTLLAAAWAAAALLAVNAIAAGAAQALPALAQWLSDPLKRAPRRRADGPDPFVSIHVLVRPGQRSTAAAALAAIRAIAYPAYEVLVLDRAGALDEPAALPVPPDQPDGAALNAALEATDWRARHIAVIEGDFAPHPRFLRLAVDHLRRAEVHYVQFPRFVAAGRRGAGGPVAAAGLDLERGDALAQAARATRAMLHLGAASVIAVDALREVGGWSAAVDAVEPDLGVRLVAAGRRGLFLDMPAGRVLRAPSYRDIREERARWLRARAEIVGRAGRALLKAGLGSAAHLFAGQAFWLAPAIALALGGVARAVERTGRYDLVIGLAAWTVILTALAATYRLLWRAASRRASIGALAAALTLRGALAWTSSTAWLSRPRGGPLDRLELPALGLGAAALAAAIAAADPPAILAGVLLLGGWLSARAAERIWPEAP